MLNGALQMTVNTSDEVEKIPKNFHRLVLLLEMTICHSTWLLKDLFFSLVPPSERC